MTTLIEGYKTQYSAVKDEELSVAQSGVQRVCARIEVGEYEFHVLGESPGLRRAGQ